MPKRTNKRKRGKGLMESRKHGVLEAVGSTPTASIVCPLSVMDSTQLCEG